MFLIETDFGGKKWTELGERRAQELTSVLKLQFISVINYNDYRSRIGGASC
jgi:hypothetical protein